MGRELRRKQAKREGKNVREVQKQQEQKPLSPKTFATIMVVLVVFLIILAILTGIFITNDIKLFDNKDKDETVTEIENKILAINSLRQSEEDYYVYYYDTTDNDQDVANALTSVKEKVYKVDLNDELNSNFVGEPSGIVQNISDLKVSNPTLIKVSSEKIVAFYFGTEEITAALK